MIPDKDNKVMRVAISLFLAGTTFLTYWQVLDHGFLNFDDNRYVSENPHITQGLTLESMKWAFMESYTSNWHPVTWLSHMLDFEIYGTNPSGHHLTNILFHIANVILLFGVLLKMTGALWRSGFVAALFALHPLNVESVAWIAERKNLLSTFFWFLTMWSYLDYVKKGQMYLLMVLFLALGLMAKPMLVTLPFVLVLLDFWPLKRWDWGNMKKTIESIKASIIEKIPLFILVVGSCVTTYMVQKGGDAVRSTELRSLYSGLTNALVSYLEYLGKMVWPQRLSVFYPHPGNTLPAWKVLACGVVLVWATVWVVKRIRNMPYLTVGWLWYLGSLVPVIGIVQVGEQAMADRYTYIPMVGIFIAISWGLSDLMKNGKQKFLPLLAGIFILILTALTWVQAGYWKNGVTLFSHAISVVENETPSFVIAHNNLGHALFSEKRYEESVKQYQQAIKINPHYAVAHNNLGTALIELNRYDQAIDHYREAIKLKPDYAEAYNNLGNALGDKGELNESINYYKNAIRLKKDYADAYSNLGIRLSETGQYEAAIVQYQKALEINPGLFQVHNNLAILLSSRGEIIQAIEHYREAIALDPGFTKAHNNLGSTLAGQGRFEEAIEHFEKALSIDPDYIDAQKNLDLARSLTEKN